MKTLALLTLRWPSGEPRIPVYTHEPELLFQKHEGRRDFVRLVSARDT